MNRVDNLFFELKALLESELATGGFRLVEEEHHTQSFGSRYVQYENDSDAIRLAWDGKDYWFALEASPVQAGTSNRAWSDLALQPFKRLHRGTRAQDSVKHHIVEALREYLADTNAGGSATHKLAHDT